MSINGNKSLNTIFQYSKEKVDETLRRKQHTEIKTLYLLQATAVISALLMAFDDNNIITQIHMLIYPKTQLNYNDWICLIAYMTLIFTIIILVISLNDTILNYKVFRNLLKKFYKIDIDKELRITEDLQRKVAEVEKQYNRKLIPKEEKNIKKNLISTKCKYQDMPEPSILLDKLKEDKYKDDDKFYEMLIKNMNMTVLSGQLINKAKDMCFNMGLFLFLISIILILINKMILIF